MRRRRRRRASRLTALGVVAALGLSAAGIGTLTGGDGGADTEFVVGASSLEAPPVADAPDVGFDEEPPAPAEDTAAPAADREEADQKADVRRKRAKARAAARARRVAAAVPDLPSFPRASGRYEVAPGRDAVEGAGRVVRYLVEVEDGLGIDPAEFAAHVHRVLNSPGGWGRGGKTLRFERVASGDVRFRVALSSPALTDAQCAPLRTYGDRSCFNGRRAVINAARWVGGAVTYGGDLRGYRAYVVNHEVGHALGHRHVGCPSPGEPAPLMVQQTKSLGGCTANPWPYPARAARAEGLAAGGGAGGVMASRSQAR